MSRTPTPGELRRLANAARNARGLSATGKRALSQRALELVQRHGRASIRQSAGQPAVSFVNDIRRAMSGSGVGGMIGRLLEDSASAAAGQAFMSDVQRYARSGFAGSLLRTLLNRLGPIGKAIDFVLGRKKSATGIPNQAILDAIDLLTQAGFEVRAPGMGRIGGASRPGNIAEAIGRATGSGGTGGPAAPTAPPYIVTRAPSSPLGVPGGSGGGVTLPPGPPSTPAGRAPTTRPGRPAAPTPPGAPPQPPTPPTEPPLPTGTVPGNRFISMELVSGSSNVYAIGYDPQSRTLRVQFLGGSVRRSSIRGRGHRGRNRARGQLGRTLTSQRHGPGATYDYFNVPQKIWNRLRAASSKGGAVWDLLRVRGTVYGHQYDYQLVAASVFDVVETHMEGGKEVIGRRVGRITYVPRKAVAAGRFQGRNIQQGTRQFRSILPNQGMRDTRDRQR